MMDWTSLQMRQVAYVMAQTVAAMARLEGMKALNAERAFHGQSAAYTEADFEQIATDFGLHHNAVLTTLDQFLKG